MRETTHLDITLICKNDVGLALSVISLR